MSEDEVFALVMSLVASVISWGLWYAALTSVAVPRGSARARVLLLVTPVIATVGLSAALRAWAAVDVRDSGEYLFFYVALGLAWVGLGRALFGILGVSWKHDALECGNPAAAIATAGGVLGLMACYAGANVGDGPGWWCVVVAGGIATIAWFAAWLALDRLGSTGESVSLERDPAAGWRLGGFLVAAGVICGRGAAGDWHSAEQTVREFSAAWPLVPLIAAALILERIVAPARVRTPSPVFASGVVPALVYLGAAILALVIVGPPVMGARGAGP
jgi:hypothetical protein